MSTLMSKWRKKPAEADAAAAPAADVEAAGAANPFETDAGADAVAGDAVTSAAHEAAPPAPAPAAAEKKSFFGKKAKPAPSEAPRPPPPVEPTRDAPARAPSAEGGGGGIYAVKEAGASAISVAALIAWTVAITVWTGFQVVQNALWYQHIRGLNLGYTPLENQVGTSKQASGDMEEQALWIVLAVEAALTIVFPVLAVALLWLPYLHSCRGGVRPRRTKRSFVPWFCTLLLVCAAWFKLFAIVSLITKLHAHKAWCTIHQSLDIKFIFNPSANPDEPVPGCQQIWFAGALRYTIVFAVATIIFHMLLFFGHQPFSTLGKAYGMLPTILTVGLLLVKPVTSLMNWYYTEGHFTAQANFTFTSEMIVALIAFITAIWLSVYMGWAVHSVRLIPRFTNTLLACCGRKYEDVYYEHERRREGSAHEGRKSYSLRAAIRSMIQQWFYMVQLPAVFGFVSPMITYASLNEQNWWIRADIIAGAVMLFVYMVVCAFHRQLLAPPKARTVVVVQE